MDIFSRCKKAIAIGGLFLTLTFGFSGNGSSLAIAGSLDSVHPLIAVTSTAQDLDSQIKRGLDNMAGSGTSDQLEGAAQQAAGAIKKQVGQVTRQAEGTADQIQGRAKADIGRVKGSAEDLGEAAERSGESLMDNIKDFFDS
ncbi:CsbD family protein [Lyngbya confervoides]|uniref:CsbD family protein n=1 Tax=Lyngbya confervoides BDU141951 TaxID=1574623 RepID=A0ABD4SZF6_9CYAN|nr:CsbD family protein [Lyngbya confervoides]MCM1981694.1 CsbD family protein [Lyngbya confervoides BDU141951]